MKVTEAKIGIVGVIIVFVLGGLVGNLTKPDCPDAPVAVETVAVEMWCVRVNGVVFAEECFVDSLQADSIYRELAAVLDGHWRKFELGGVTFSNRVYNRVTIDKRTKRVTVGEFRAGKWGWPAADEADAWRLLGKMNDAYDSTSALAREAIDSIETLNAVLTDTTEYPTHRGFTDTVKVNWLDTNLVGHVTMSTDPCANAGDIPIRRNDSVVWVGAGLTLPDPCAGMVSIEAVEALFTYHVDLVPTYYTSSDSQALTVETGPPYTADTTVVFDWDGWKRIKEAR